MASYEMPLTQEAVDHAWLGKIINIIRWVFIKVYSLDYKNVTLYTGPFVIWTDRIKCYFVHTGFMETRDTNIKIMRDWIKMLIRLNMRQISYKGLEHMAVTTVTNHETGSMHRIGKIVMPKIGLYFESVGGFDPTNKEEEYKFVNAMMNIWAPMAHDQKLMNYLSDVTKPFADETNADRITNILRNYKETVPHLACSFCQQMPTRRVRWKLCGKCRSVRYCSKECQLVHWGHYHGDCESPGCAC